MSDIESVCCRTFDSLIALTTHDAHNLKQLIPLESWQLE